VDGSIICPPQFVPCPTSSTTLIPNPEYQFWVQQDKLILSVIISILSEIVLTHDVGLHKSLDVWTTLEKMFASQSKARIMQIRLQLATLKKGDSSIADYFQKAQTLAHTLAAINEPLKESEVITYIMAGLSTDYDSLVTLVSTCVDPISLEDLYGHLLTHEQRIELHNTAPDISSSSVNVAQRHSSINHASCGSHNSLGYSYAGRGKGRGRGRGPSSHGHFSSSNFNNRPMCQICGKLGHFAAKCYNHFDNYFQSDSQGPSAYFTAPHVASDPSWYHDTGSTHHLTNDLSKLNIRADEYMGTDQIRVGNGQGLQISHTGLDSLPSHSKNFSLQSLLHVPQIQKNLISINKFTHDNQVFIEFHPTYFCVKDLKSRRLLLQGPSKGGLYPWPSRLSFSCSPSTLIGERVSVDQWHSQLGHPALRVIRRLLTSHQLLVTSNKTVPVCSSCQLGKLHKLHFPVSPSVSTGPLDLLFMDVWGHAPLFSNNNKRYFLCIVDDFSCYFWVFPLTCKSDVITVFTNFKRLVENFFGHSIKSVQTDGGWEFIRVQKLLKSHGISYRQTYPHTHHQKGSVERKIRHIVDTSLALLAHSHVPFKFWDNAFDTACYLINRLPSALNSVLSPFELLFNKSPDFNLLKVFGCECWPYLRPYNSHKMSFRSSFLGVGKISPYPQNRPGPHRPAPAKNGYKQQF
jgi:hypothetical protein